MNSEQLVETINDQKAEITALKALLCSVVRSLPSDSRDALITEWQEDIEISRTVLLNSSAPEALLEAFDKHTGLLGAAAAIRP